MTIIQVLALLGGLSIFLYGMRTMSNGLKKAAGARFKTIIEKLTKNVLRGVIVGAVVTGIVQSSAATTVIAVGFANAGVMTLTQAVGVIMGANIGTTITAQILRLGDIQADVWYLAMLKPGVLGPILFLIGVVVIMLRKRKRHAVIGEILVGFGLLFCGMNMMEWSVSGLHAVPGVQKIFMQLENPILGLVAGMMVTAIIQSSTASVGILQAVAATGLVSFSAAVPIIMGQNIGSCVTPLISSIGMEKSAKKVALVNLYFNLIGTMVLMPLIYLINYLFKIPFWNLAVNRGGIADFHTVFNIANTLLLLPFVSLLVRLTDKTVNGR